MMDIMLFIVEVRVMLYLSNLHMSSCLWTSCLFICGLFPDAFDGSDNIALDDGINTK